MAKRRRARNPFAAMHEELARQADDCALLAALVEVTRSEPPGSLLLVRVVRAQAKLSKERFDRAAMRLSGERRIILHHHDYPGSLSPAARAELVLDRGVYYVGIAER